MTYELRFTGDPREFLAGAGDVLAADPVLTTVIATVTSRAATDVEAGRPTPDYPQWWVTVVDDVGTVVGVAMRTAPFAPYPLFVLPMPDAAATLLGEALVERGEAGAGANGALPAARLVAEAAARGVGLAVKVEMHSRLWVLGQLREPAAPAGGARPATLDDLDLAYAWFADFHAAAEAQAGRSSEPVGGVPEFDRAEVERRIVEDRIWLWVDEAGNVVSLTGFNLPSFGVARVGPVYTPTPERGNGYASALVFHVSRLIRAGGDQACLFTDQANPTSNKIYAAVGYEPVVDMANHAVVNPDSSAPPSGELHVRPQTNRARPGPA